MSATIHTIPFATDLHLPEGPVYLPDGSWLCVEDAPRGTVTLLSADGQTRRVVARTGRPNGLAVDRDGVIWVAESGEPLLLRVAMDGRAESFLTGCGDERFLFPNDLCFGPDGALYLTDSGILPDDLAPGNVIHPHYDQLPYDGRVYRIDTATKAITRLDSGLRLTNGIDATQNERHLIRNVQGQPLRRGIYVDAVYDVGRIENVHFNPWWSVQPPVRDWMMANGEAFVIGRSDWQYISNTFCFGYGIGYRFIKTAAGHGRSNGNFAGLGADDCAVCVQVEACAPEGLLITNGEFVSLHGPDPTQVVVTATNGGTVRFVNCGFFGPSHQIARLSGHGTTAFSDCAFVTWDGQQQGRAAIQVLSGKVQIRGCEFWEDKPQIDLGPEVQQAVVSDCLFPQTLRIANHSRGRVRVTPD